MNGLKMKKVNLNQEEIKRRLKRAKLTEFFRKEIRCYKELDSTNLQAARLAEQGAEHGTLVLAEFHTQGKGRRGRNWFSPLGTSVYMSLLLKPELDPSKVSMLTLVQALAVSRGIEDTCGIAPQIKWPNDILVNEKKICGILTELRMEKNGINSVIIGTGINLNQTEFPSAIGDIASSLKKETGRTISREEVIGNIMIRFEYYYGCFLKTENLSLLREEYNARLINGGRKVKVLDPKGEFRGEALGINELGELLIKREDGKIIPIYAGEVSVRGIYGYV